MGGGSSYKLQINKKNHTLSGCFCNLGYTQENNNVLYLYKAGGGGREQILD